MLQLDTNKNIFFFRSVTDVCLILITGISELPTDDGLPSTVTVLDAPDGGKVYLVGTAHFSIQSQEDVSRVSYIIKL